MHGSDIAEGAHRVVSVRMPADLDAALRASARANERSVAGELRAVLREHLVREYAFADGFASVSTPRGVAR